MADTGPGVTPSSRQLDTLEAWALAYLGLPVVVFLAGFVQPLPALGLALLLAGSAWPVWRARTAGGGLAAGPAWVVAAVAVGWVVLSGLPGGLRVNEDWQVRLLVLRDLVVGAWPVGYDPDAGDDLVLRLPIGYYLVPALAGKLLGWPWARLAAAAWTALGTGLFLALALRDAALRGRARLVTGLLVALLFSGMDVIGWHLYKPEPLSAGLHIEWWHWLFQYSSNTTLLFWAPNHALPGWLAAALLWRHRQAGLAVAPMALWMLAILAWSPLVVVGAAPLLLAATFKGAGLRGVWREALRPGPWLAVPTGLLLARFETFGVPPAIAATSAEAARLQMELLVVMVPQVLEFSLVEWLLLALLVWRIGGGSWLLTAAAVCLLLLPGLRLGPGNDIVMRGGIPALTLVMMGCVHALTAPMPAARWQPVLKALLVAVLLVGSVTPLLEMQRAFRTPEPAPDAGKTFTQTVGRPWHYIGIRQDDWLWQVLRAPAVLR